ncbi:hypothetical protein OTK51_13360 [Vibrio scophthalmi]|uniref:hypothetical protein n=1 Tax=Vibrio scophthalmi TaxID=45658 RepID=UPI002283BA3B|nr:hypothetical protein [Vibrio scophthalmi]MCY9804416.1 hypothetical protein [Vibrio scophthalmi]
MSYENQYNNNFYSINRRVLESGQAKTRFFNYELNETGLKFRNYLLSEMAMNPDSKIILVNKKTRKSKSCDFPFKDKTTIENLLATFKDAYFSIFDKEDHIEVRVNPAYFEDFANATLQVKLTYINTRSMAIMYQELINLYIAKNSGNFTYRNKAVAEQNLKETTSITDYRDRKRAFKATIKRQLKSCFTIDSSSVVWNSEKDCFTYNLTKETIAYKKALQELQDTGEKTFNLTELYHNIKNAVKSVIKAVKKKVSNVVKNVVKPATKQTPATPYFALFEEIQFDDEEEVISTPTTSNYDDLVDDELLAHFDAIIANTHR